MSRPEILVEMDNGQKTFRGEIFQKKFFENLHGRER